MKGWTLTNGLITALYSVVISYSGLYRGRLRLDFLSTKTLHLVCIIFLPRLPHPSCNILGLKHCHVLKAMVSNFIHSLSEGDLFVSTSLKYGLLGLHRLMLPNTLPSTNHFILYLQNFNKTSANTNILKIWFHFWTFNFCYLQIYI